MMAKKRGKFRMGCRRDGKAKSTDAWVDRIAGALLEVPHLHLTLTIAQQLRVYFEQDRNLLRVLLSVALKAVREVIAKKYPGLRVGFIFTCHTSGRDLHFNPHVHLVMTKGGLRNGQWIEIEQVPGGSVSKPALAITLSGLSSHHAIGRNLGAQTGLHLDAPLVGNPSPS